MNIFTEAFLKQWLVSKEEVNKRNNEKIKNEKYKSLISKYWDMIELYKEFSYKNSNWEYDSKIFNEVPKKIIKEKFTYLDKNWKQKSKLTSTKLRQYYDIVNSLFHSKISWEALKSELYMLLAKANYDLWRRNLPQEFISFLRINIDMIYEKGDEYENFIIFKKHFEALVAYSKWVLQEK